MGTRHLEALFNPKSVVIAGASERSDSLGGIVLRNLLAGDYSGRLAVVNANSYEEVHGIPCVRRVDRLKFIPDLAIICTPPESIPSLVRELGKHRVRTAMILTGGLSRTHSKSGRPLMCSVEEVAREQGVRILGPETIGVLAPHNGFNATYLHMGAKPGKIAFIGQSGTMASAMVDWAFHRGVGFSHLTTLGDGIDVDLDDLIDYLTQDRKTRAILLHMENITSPRRFVSAVRAASRSKPIIALKSGRNREAQWSAIQGPSGLESGDRVYDAVLRRAGVLRVNGTDEMFDALETLTRMKPIRNPALHILTNGFGPGVMAVDRLQFMEGRLGELKPDTAERLAAFLPKYWTRRNPIDLNYDAGPQTYMQALETLQQDQDVHNVLVMFAPTLTEDSLQIADQVIEFNKRSRLNIFTCWLGHSTIQDARHAFYDSGIPTYTTPEKAIKAFMHMVNHQRSQRVLRETPESYRLQNEDRGRARKQLLSHWESGQRILTPMETYNLLMEYGVPMNRTRFVKDSEDAINAARQLGGDVDLHLLHEEGCQPFSDSMRLSTDSTGWVRWLSTGAEVLEACRALKSHHLAARADSAFMGYAVSSSRAPSGGLGFSIGITRDPVFGPLIFCGASGARLNTLTDRQVALPPLNLVLARDLIHQTYMARVTRSVASEAERYINILAETLVTLSEMVADNPEIESLEIAPFCFDAEGAYAVMATCRLSEPMRATIMPYPRELREWVMLPRSRRHVELRPVRGEDEPAHIAFHEKLSPESIRYRYFHYRKSFSHDEMVQMLQLDYDREMAFAAVAACDDKNEHRPEGRQDCPEELLGVVRTWTDADNLQCEFAIIISDQLRGEHLGWVLMRKMIEYSRERGTIEMTGTVLPENKPMLKLAEKLGFESEYDPEDEVVMLRLQLNEPDEWQASRLSHRK